jgi:hypothetical protein
MSLEYKILGQELVSYTDVPGTDDTTSYYVTYEESGSPIYVSSSGSNDQSAYSFDGINWTRQTLPLNSSLATTAFGNKKIVGIANGGRVLISEDGINWQVFDGAPFYNTSTDRISFAGGKFFYKNFISSNGVDWESTNYPSLFGIQIAFGNGKFVSPNFNEARIYYSTDAINWSFTEFPVNSSPQAVVFAEGKFVLVGIDGVFHSLDGVSWTKEGVFEFGARKVLYGNEKFFAYGSTTANTSALAYSLDGVVWSELASPNGGSIEVATFGDGKFILPSLTNPQFFYSSLDGITWTAGPGVQFLNTQNELVFGDFKTVTETLNIIGGQGTTQTEEFLPITVYTVPAEKQTTVTSIFVANHDDTDSTYDLAVVPAGEDLSLKHHIRWDMAVAANDFENISTKITMSAGDKLVIFPSTVDTVSITAFGVEK